MWSRTGKTWRLVGAGNAREHWGSAQRRAKAQRSGAAEATRELGADLLSWPGWRVTVTRLGPRRLDDDNAVASAKHVRDGIADAVGVDDGNPRFAWAVRQRPSKTFGVEVEIAPLDAPNPAGAVRAAKTLPSCSVAGRDRMQPLAPPRAGYSQVGEGLQAPMLSDAEEHLAIVTELARRTGVSVDVATQPLISGTARSLRETVAALEAIRAELFGGPS
ncbi:MAG: hypothetical protein HOO96_24020 [Polyangiaceae bacterium]|nr:hypothetical protein [Polyangiaceae bacterium]